MTFRSVGRGGGGHVDVEAKVARVQVGVELLNEGEIGGAGIVVEIFDVERKAVIAGKCGEEAQDLLPDLVTLGRVFDHVAHGRIAALRMRVEVVEMGKDFSVFPCLLDDALDLVVFVGVVNDAALEDGEFMAVGGGSLEVERRRIEVQPLREKQVDLVDVLLKGRVAGRVLGDVVGGAQSFAGVEGNIGGLAIGLAACGASGLLAACCGSPVLQCPVGVLLGGQQQFRQVLAAEYIEDKAGEHERGDDRRDVEYAAEALPSGSLGIEKYLFIGHRRFYGIQYESYGS